MFNSLKIGNPQDSKSQRICTVIKNLRLNCSSIVSEKTVADVLESLLGLYALHYYGTGPFQPEDELQAIRVLISLTEWMGLDLESENFSAVAPSTAEIHATNRFGFDKILLNTLKIFGARF